MIKPHHAARLLVIAAFAVPRTRIEDGPVLCPFRRVTGLPCPSCGLTRSWVAAADLRLGESLAYHPLGAATLLGAAAMALAGPEVERRSGEHRFLLTMAGTLWVATWLWRLAHARQD